MDDGPQRYWTLYSEFKNINHYIKVRYVSNLFLDRLFEVKLIGLFLSKSPMEDILERP